MFLRGRPLLQFDMLPLGCKIPCRHCFATPFNAPAHAPVKPTTHISKRCAYNIISPPWMKGEKSTTNATKDRLKKCALRNFTGQKIM
jgi:hypothetical protein